MTLESLAPLAALFVEPWLLPPRARLWLFLPLALCIALVYQATRAETAAELPRRTSRTFINLVVGMVVIAAGFYVAHQAALRWW
jgi:hypothetical protein